MTAGAGYTYWVIHKVCFRHKINVINFGSHHREYPINMIEEWLKDIFSDRIDDLV